MTKKQLQDRFELLGNILYHSRDRGYFSSGQRTCLNMERSAIIRAINHIELDERDTAKPSYTIPEHLEVKCKQVITDFKI